MKRADTIDMSPAAISRRLEDLRQLYRLGCYLKRFKIVEPADFNDRPKTESPIEKL
jgi:hypothetical protein